MWKKKDRESWSDRKVLRVNSSGSLGWINKNGKNLLLENKYTPLLDIQTIYIKGGKKNISKELRERLNFIQGSFLSLHIYLSIYYKHAILYKRKQFFWNKRFCHFYQINLRSNNKLEQSKPTLSDISISQCKSDRYFYFLLPFGYISEIRNIWIMKHFTSVITLTLSSLPFRGSR